MRDENSVCVGSNLDGIKVAVMTPAYVANNIWVPLKHVASGAEERRGGKGECHGELCGRIHTWDITADSRILHGGVVG